MGDPRVKSERRGSPALAPRSVMTPFSAQELLELAMHLMTRVPQEIKRNAYLKQNELWHRQHWKSKRDFLSYERKELEVSKGAPSQRR